MSSQTPKVRVRGDAIVTVIMGDPHITDVPPASRDTGYLEELRSLFEQVAVIAERVDADEVLCTGDWFHRKNATKHSETATVIRWLRSMFKKPILTVVGNHDARGHRVAPKAIAGQPLGVLVEAGVVRVVAPVYSTLPEQGPKLVTRGRNSLFVSGVSYMQDPDRKFKSDILCNALSGAVDAVQHSRPANPTICHSLTLTHLDTSIVGGVPAWAARIGAKLNPLIVGVPVIVNGHIHTQRGLVKDTPGKSSKCLFYGAGCIGRTSVIEKSCPAVVVATFLSEWSGVHTEGVKIRMVPLSVGDEDAGFVDLVAETDQEAKERDARLQEFAVALTRHKSTVVDVDRVIDTVAGQHFQPNVIAIAKQLVKESSDAVTVRR